MTQHKGYISSFIIAQLGRLEIYIGYQVEDYPHVPNLVASLVLWS